MSFLKRKDKKEKIENEADQTVIKRRDYIPVALVGAGGVGAKSCLIVYYVTGRFVNKYDPTIEEPYIVTKEIFGDTYRFDVIDTAGQEEYAVLRNYYITIKDAFIIGYGVNSGSSFRSLDDIVRAIERIKMKPIREIPVVIVGNKADLEANREVSVMQGFHKAKAWNASFIETSAMLGVNIDECFHLLVEEWHKKNNFNFQ